MRTRLRVILPAAVALARPALLHACTVCHTDTGQAVRAGIFDGHFFGNALRLAAPFPIFLLAAALVSKGLPLGDPAPAAEAGNAR